MPKQRKDITDTNCIADSLRPILQDMGKLRRDQYKSNFDHYTNRCIEAISDERVVASNKQRNKWLNAVNSQKDMVGLMFLLSNIELGASNNRLDRATTKKSAQFAEL